MDKFIRIFEFAQQLFADEKTARQASEIIEGIMTSRSPRLSDIAAHMPGEEAACYKRIQRFLQVFVLGSFLVAQTTLPFG